MAQEWGTKWPWEGIVEEAFPEKIIKNESADMVQDDINETMGKVERVMN